MYLISSKVALVATVTKIKLFFKDFMQNLVSYITYGISLGKWNKFQIQTQVTSLHTLIGVITLTKTKP